MKCVFLIFAGRKNHGWKPVSFEKDASNGLVEYAFHTTLCIAIRLKNDAYSWSGKLQRLDKMPCCNFLFREISECQFERNLDVKLGHVLI